MEYEFLVTPIGKPRMTQRDKWLKPPREAVLKYRLHKKAMEDYAMITKFKLTEILDVDFYIPMPESWSKKKKESMCGKPHQNKPDLDNILKFIMDTLLPEGDQNVHTIVAKKVWDYEGKIIFRDATNE
jgi:Holliday junction resolvase RusA-like endonuclease